MTQSNTISVQTTPNGALNVRAMKEAIRLIEVDKAKEGEERTTWRVMNLDGIEIREWQMPVMNATV